MIWEEIFLYSLLFLFLLHVIGHPILKVIERAGGLDSALANLDPIQKLPIEFVLGGAGIYVWALVATPFNAFTYENSWILTIGFTALYILFTFTGHKRPREVFSSKGIPLFSSFAFAVFVFALWFRILPLPSFTLGSVNDSALHTLFVYAIIRNGGIPMSIPSVAPVVLQFPQGLQVVLAYFTMMTGMPPELVTFYELAYFNATIILAAYAFSSVMFSKQYALIVELILAGISVTPIDITWGAQIIPWSMTISFVILTLAIPKFIKKGQFTLKFSNLLPLLLPGILLGYLASVYAPLLFILGFVFFVITVMEFQDIRNRILAFITFMSLSVPLFGLWIYRFEFVSDITSSFQLAQISISNYTRAYNAGLQWFPFKNMSSIAGVATGIWNWISWPASTQWPGSIFLFPALLIIGAGIFILGLLSKDRLELPQNLLKYIFAAFIGILFWGANSPVGLFYFTWGPVSIIVPELDKASVIAGTFLLAFLAALPLYLIISRPSRITRRILEDHRKLLTAVVIGGLVVCNFVIIPYGTNWLRGNYGVYAVASTSDYQLLQWMRTGIPQNSVVLINPYDAGQYVASVSNKSVVGMYTGVAFTSSAYENLTILLRDNVMNSTTISLFNMLGVNYVFVGSKAFESGWSPEFFIDHCLAFKDVASYNSSYLFQVISTNPRFAETVCQYI